MVVETIFTDGSSQAATYNHSSEAEAMQHAWHVGRLTGKEVATVHRLRSLKAARAIAAMRSGAPEYAKS